MTQVKTTLDTITLIGKSIRTNNQSEMNPTTAKIASLAGEYWGSQMADDFNGRTNPGVTYSAYTDYASDEHGDYTYFIGEAVDPSQEQDLSKFDSLIIPKATYQKFTSPTGIMPNVVLSLWQKIWQMSRDEMGGMRAYRADFEIYDQRAVDPNNTVVDIYIGIE